MVRSPERPPGGLKNAVLVYLRFRNGDAAVRHDSQNQRPAVVDLGRRLPGAQETLINQSFLRDYAPRAHDAGVGARFGVVIPALNEFEALARSARRFQCLRRLGCELVLADGGSMDGSDVLGRANFDKVVTTSAGRARQMNAGAEACNRQWLVFAHADTQLEAEHLRSLAAALDRDPNRRWGRFDVRLSGSDLRLRVIERAMNLRSRLTGIATGDQSIFVRADEFRAAGGYADQPLMEDIAISKVLRRRSWPLCLAEKVTTSSRRWERNGVFRTMALMWRLRLAYALGVHPQALARHYYPDQRYDGPGVGG